MFGRQERDREPITPRANTPSVACEGQLIIVMMDMTPVFIPCRGPNSSIGQL